MSVKNTPIESTLDALPAQNAANLTGKEFFPHLISGPFHHGLLIVFTAAALMSAVGALVSLLRGRQFYYEDGPASAAPPASPPATRNGQANRQPSAVPAGRPAPSLPCDTGVT